MKVSEYVSLGHPDKIADYISERILDALIEQDPFTRYALEVQVKYNFVTLGGEITTKAEIDYDEVVKRAVREIGYTKEYAEYWGAENALCADDIQVTKHISQQSGDIAQGLKGSGWGDQGIFFGYAVKDEKTGHLPRDYFYAKRICQTLFARGIGGLDIKSQVYYDEDLKRAVKAIVAIPTKQDITEDVTALVREIVDNPECDVIVNGTGRYVKHSSMGDCGTTGRKLAVDFYGGNCEVGGGSPWTKDASKADLTLNLLARFVALKYMKKYAFEEVKVKLACCIGNSEIDCYVYENGRYFAKDKLEYCLETLKKRFNLDKPVYGLMCKDGLFTFV